MIVDLDPSDPASDVRAAAVDFGALLRELGLEPFAMTTGSRGFHVVAPLQRRQDFDTYGRSRATSRGWPPRGIPERLTVEMRKAKRGGRILVDVARNAYAQTAVAPYSVRARPGRPGRHAAALGGARGRGHPARRVDAATIPGRLERGRPWRSIGKRRAGCRAPPAARRAAHRGRLA